MNTVLDRVLVICFRREDTTMARGRELLPLTPIVATRTLWQTGSRKRRRREREKVVRVTTPARDRLPMPNIDSLMDWDSPAGLYELDDDPAPMNTNTEAGAITANLKELVGGSAPHPDVLDTALHPDHCPSPMNISMETGTITASTEDTATVNRKRITIRDYLLNGTESVCLRDTSPATGPRRQSKGKRKKKTTFSSSSQLSILHYFQNLQTGPTSIKNINRGEKRKLEIDGTEQHRICNRKRPALTNRNFNSKLNPVIESKGGVKPRVRQTDQPIISQLEDELDLRQTI